MIGMNISHKALKKVNINNSSTEKIPTLTNNRSDTQDEVSMNKSPEEVKHAAIRLFNKSPIKGMKAIIAQQISDPSPAGFANFLKNEKLLKKTAIGQFVGDKDEFARDVLVAYTNLFEFINIEFDEALRVFLAAFTLPGEAQMIDRVMSTFATRFRKCNPNLPYDSQDVTYVLAFSLIMLNTDAHNPNVPPERRMTKDQYVKNLRGVDNGKDLPDTYLEKLYDNIVTRPFARDYERDEFSQWDKQGFIHVLILSAKFAPTTQKRKTDKGKTMVVHYKCRMFIHF